MPQRLGRGISSPAGERLQNSTLIRRSLLAAAASSRSNRFLVLSLTMGNSFLGALSLGSDGRKDAAPSRPWSPIDPPAWRSVYRWSSYAVLSARCLRLLLRAPPGARKKNEVGDVQTRQILVFPKHGGRVRNAFAGPPGR